MAEVLYTQVKLNRPRQRVECNGKARACTSETKMEKLRGKNIIKNLPKNRQRSEKELFNTSGGTVQKGKGKKCIKIFIFFHQKKEALG